jgi:hypothetical protein
VDEYLSSRLHVANMAASQTGLFAATVAAFVIESYKQLSPDTGAQTVKLLSQLVDAKIDPLPPISTSSADDFVLPMSAVIANTFWFLSLILSLICALGATLVQQWARNYIRQNQRRRAMEKRGIRHIILFKGIKRFGLSHASDFIVALLHLAVALFMIGLVIFLFPINPIVAWSSLCLIAIAAVVYTILSTLPVVAQDCPYRTPVTPINHLIWRPVSLVLRTVWSASLPLLSSLCFAFILALSPRRAFRDGLHQARAAAQRLISTFDNLFRPYLFPRAAELDTEPTPLHIRFAVERVLQGADDMVELEDFFDSFSHILDWFLQHYSPESLKTVLYFLDELCIADHLKKLLSEKSLSSVAAPPHIFLRRSVIALRVTNRILEIIFRDAYQKDPWLYCLRVMTLCAMWKDFCSSDDPAIQLVAQAHIAVLRQFLLRLKDDWMYPWSYLYFMDQHILFLHRPSFCSCCKAFDNDDWFSKETPCSFSPHFGPSNLLTLLNNILTASPATVHAQSTVWLPLLADVMSGLDTPQSGVSNRNLTLDGPQSSESIHTNSAYEHTDRTGLEHHPLSADFKRVFKDSGLAAWLAADSDFTSDPEGGLPVQMQMLERYPELLKALRKLAVAAAHTCPVRGQKVCLYSLRTVNLAERCNAGVRCWLYRESHGTLYHFAHIQCSGAVKCNSATR